MLSILPLPCRGFITSCQAGARSPCHPTQRCARAKHDRGHPALGLYAYAGELQ